MICKLGNHSAWQSHAPADRADSRPTLSSAANRRGPSRPYRIPAARRRAL